jgi:hypothetical protein
VVGMSVNKFHHFILSRSIDVATLPCDRMECCPSILSLVSIVDPNLRYSPGTLNVNGVTGAVLRLATGPNLGGS